MATQETYENLKKLLDEEKYPKPYVFKFIIKNRSSKGAGD